MKIPKTQKGLSNQITRIRSQLSTFKKEYGFIDDGSGNRYYLFYLYFLLGDNRRSSEYISWYEKEFPDDSNESAQLLCWALILHRMGKNGDYRLASAMLSNLYLIPNLLGEKLNRVDMWHSSSDKEPDYVEYFPERIKEAITQDDLTWIRKMYKSEPFQNLLKRYTEINKELETSPVGPERSKLVKEVYSLLDDWL